MLYRLIVTRPNGSQFQSGTEPLADREATGMAVLRVLADQSVAFGRDGLRLGREIRDGAVGETVTHAPSGYRFRVEEWQP